MSVTSQMTENEQGGSLRNVSLLTIAALGVVYGDIGTSPIYAFREALAASGAAAPPAREASVLGILSLIFWALTITVSGKYALIVLRADNKGEGGTLSLMALIERATARRSPVILTVAMIGVALFFGDAMIAPAISVLSAVEGVALAAPVPGGLIVPATVVIILCLFSVQRFGTHRVAAVFGPVMAIWFIVLGATGLVHIFYNPMVLLALNPLQGAMFILQAPMVGFITLGAVFLAVTGAEALYVDLGHFGRRPIVRAWFGLVFPSLLLNYYGQGAYVLGQETMPANPFFEMHPDWALIPFSLLTTLATIIASQACISGAYSTARQAAQLNLLPRLEIRHTSEAQEGQIYLPAVNWILAAGVLLFVIGMGESGKLASAYGIAVTGTMLTTTILLSVVLRRIWRWSLPLAILLTVGLLMVESAYLFANILKVLQGGWASLVVAAVGLVIMSTWVKGSRALFEATRKTDVPLRTIVEQLEKKSPHIVPGTAVFLSGEINSTPTALLHSLKHYKVLHKRNIILHVQTTTEPFASDEERIEMKQISPLFLEAVLRFGFMERPNVPLTLGRYRQKGWTFEIMDTSFFLSRRSLRNTRSSTLTRWRYKLFVTLAGAASDVAAYFCIPAGRAVEIGTQVNA